MRTDELALTAPDPLYDAPYLVFIYAAWVVGTWVLGDLAGLGVLVLGAILLTSVALSADPSPMPHSFAADFAVILLFCGAAMGAAIFLVEGLATAPELTLAATAAALASATIISVTRPRAQQ